MTWRSQASCRHHPTDLFFPESSDIAGLRAAQAICRTCPVTDECLEAAAREEMTTARTAIAGVRGGLSGRQRRSLYARRASDRHRKGVTISEGWAS